MCQQCSIVRTAWCAAPLSYIEVSSGVGHVQQYKSLEPAYVDQVVLLGGETGTEPLQRVYIKLRIEVCVRVCVCCVCAMSACMVYCTAWCMRVRMAVQVLLLLRKLATDKVAMVTALDLAQRNAIYGDKFASHAGQKGICSQNGHWSTCPSLNLALSRTSPLTFTAFPLA